MNIDKFTTKSATFATMLRASWLQRSQDYLLCLIAFTIPLPYICCPPLIIALTLVWLLQCKPKDVIHNLKTRKALWPWLLFFLLFAAGYLYSHNKAQSLFDTQSKLCFFLLPIVIGAGIPVSKELLERIFLFFTISITCVTLFCFAHAYIAWRHTGQIFHFFYHSLVNDFDANAIYQSLYTLFSLATLLLFSWNKFFTGKQKPLKIILILIQITFLVFLSSRTLLLLFFVLLLPLYLAKTVKDKRLSLRSIMGLSISILLLFTLVFITHNPVEKRYGQIIHADTTDIWNKKHLSNGDFNNLNIRLFVWRIGMENMQEHNLWWKGAGNGDAQALQNRKMAEHGVENMDTPTNRSELYNVNLHNMYLQTLIMTGIPGLLLLLLMLFTPFCYVKFFNYKSLYLLFNLSVCIFIIQESAFQTQAGIIFYAFFSQLFWSNYYTQYYRETEKFVIF